MKAEPSWRSSRTGLAKNTETGGGGGGGGGGALDFFDCSPASSSVAASAPLLPLSLFSSAAPETLLVPTLVRMEGIDEDAVVVAASRPIPGAPLPPLPPLAAATTTKSAAAETRSTRARAALDRAAAAA